MNLDEERKAFEEQITRDGFVEFSGYSLEKDEFCNYKDERIECAWFAYLVAYSRAKAHEAEKLKGCVMIPVEPTDEIIEAMDQFDSNFGYADMRSAYKAIVKSARGGK